MNWYRWALAWGFSVGTGVLMAQNTTPTILYDQYQNPVAILQPTQSLTDLKGLQTLAYLVHYPEGVDSLYHPDGHSIGYWQEGIWWLRPGKPIAAKANAANLWLTQQHPNKAIKSELLQLELLGWVDWKSFLTSY